MLVRKEACSYIISLPMPLPKVLPQVSATQRVSRGARPVGRVSSGMGDNTGGDGGKVVANRYILKNRLGSGAFGTVFLITDLKSNHDR